LLPGLSSLPPCGEKTIERLTFRKNSLLSAKIVFEPGMEEKDVSIDGVMIENLEWALF